MEADDDSSGWKLVEREETVRVPAPGVPLVRYSAVEGDLVTHVLR